MRAVASSLKTSPVPPAGPTLHRLPPRAVRKPDCSGGTSGRVEFVVLPATVVVVSPLGTVVETGDVPVEGVVVVVLSVLVRRDGPPAAVVVVAPVVAEAGATDPVAAAVVDDPAIVVVVELDAGFLLGSEVTQGMLNWSS